MSAAEAILGSMACVFATAYGCFLVAALEWSPEFWVPAVAAAFFAVWLAHKADRL